jgi:hypothetical protein
LYALMYDPLGMPRSSTGMSVFGWIFMLIGMIQWFFANHIPPPKWNNQLELSVWHWYARGERSWRGL